MSGEVQTNGRDLPKKEAEDYWNQEIEINFSHFLEILELNGVIPPRGGAESTTLYLALKDPEEGTLEKIREIIPPTLPLIVEEKNIDGKRTIKIKMIAGKVKEIFNPKQVGDQQKLREMHAILNAVMQQSIQSSPVEGFKMVLEKSETFSPDQLYNLADKVFTRTVTTLTTTSNFFKAISFFMPAIVEVKKAVDDKFPAGSKDASPLPDEFRKVFTVLKGNLTKLEGFLKDLQPLLEAVRQVINTPGKFPEAHQADLLQRLTIFQTFIKEPDQADAA